MRKVHSDSGDFSNDFMSFLISCAHILLLISLFFCAFLVLGVYRISATAFYTYDSYDKIPYNRVGVLLGTSPNVAIGRPNEFFTNRIIAASTLYKKGKIDFILVSGDNSHQSYNEPREMMKALIKEGVPKERIIADYAGFRTIDSIIRAKHVFMLNKATIISQEFHNERAIFIARANGINAIGFNASMPSSYLSSFRVEFREFFAKIMCVFDVYFLNSQPKFLGEPIAIGDAPMPKLPTNKPKQLTSKLKTPGLSVAGLKLEQLEKLKDIAKQPTNSAFILKQEQKAKETLHKSLKKQDMFYEKEESYPIIDQKYDNTLDKYNN